MEKFVGPKTPIIYVYGIQDDVHKGILKIGQTSTKTDSLDLPPNCDLLKAVAKKRIDQQTKTAGVLYDLLYTEIACRTEASGKISYFRDTDVHNVLRKSGFQQKVFDQKNQANEWYYVDLPTVKKAIDAIKAGRTSLTAQDVQEGKEYPVFTFRKEQREAIEQTKKHFEKAKRMLWDAKMRFGKTLTALELIRRMAYRRTLIVTHRPVVNQSWYDDFPKIFHNYPEFIYISKKAGESTEKLLETIEDNQKYVCFASLQDLRGSQTAGGKHDKNDEFFTTPWDLVIIDEAHEGTNTKRGEKVLENLITGETRVLYLTGTASNLYEQFKPEEIFKWDYVMEQRAKKEWDTIHLGDHNPYAELPTMHIFTYSLGELLKEFADEEICFNFTEFFRTNEETGKFVHEKAVTSFLNLLTKEDPESSYPFSNDEFRSIFNHTLWKVPGVREAKALASLLQEHPVFGHFTVVNVAGENGEEKSDALTSVNKAIGPDATKTRTITLSCGRLTTGVSVPAWTGVLMLSGAVNTGFNTYLQTIFRVQTPAKSHDKIKEDCYVFDFAPDRTLQILFDFTHTSGRTGSSANSGDNDHEGIKTFLNFCPVIAIDGSKMIELNYEKVIEQAHRLYVNHVVQRGFQDTRLYNQELMNLSDLEIQDFNDLKAIIGETKSMEKVDSIDINRQGLTDEEIDLEEESKPKKKTLSEEEKEIQEKKKKRKKAISILNGLSIRMPLMIYGAELQNEDTPITIDNFTELVDDQSWLEFMPPGVSKEVFQKYKKYYNKDIFSSAAKRIRSLVRAADKISVEERIFRIANIFSTFRNPDKETVLTPWNVVNQHICQSFGGYCFLDKSFSTPLGNEPRFVNDRPKITGEVFTPHSHLLEINSKSGLYPLILTYNIYRVLQKKKDASSTDAIETQQALWDQVVRENIFIICKTPMAQSITRRTLLGFRKGEVHTLLPENFIQRIKSSSSDVQAALVSEIEAFVGKNMKINAIVGNPPYQEENGNTRKPPIYHHFYDIAFKLSDKVSLITPGRFLFKAGQTPEEWMDKMLGDEHLKVVEYFQNSTDVFPTVDIKGGVVITYRDDKQKLGPIGYFSPQPELRSIQHKVTNAPDFKLGAFAETISPRGISRFSELFFEEHPKASSSLGKGTGNMITSKAFELFGTVFLTDKPDDQREYIRFFGRDNRERVFRWIRKDYVIYNDFLNYYRVFVPAANGTGAIGEILSTPVIGEPVIGHTDTFLSVGKFTTRRKAENCLKYIRTKFARTLLGTLKVTQHNPKETWTNVPLQDFDKGSDIDWSKSVPDIDKQLYQKYKLSPEEISFIETNIRPM